jgi:hypothetical protein
MPPVRIYDAVSPQYFDSLQAGYNAAIDGDLLQLRDGILIGSLTADRTVAVTIRGGYDATYSAGSLFTFLQGVMLLQQGTVKVENVILR